MAVHIGVEPMNHFVDKASVYPARNMVLEMPIF
jgi:hypothetical protein